jgi:hypothetical protein
MLRRWLIGCFTVALLASVLMAKQGVVTNKQGGTFKGDVTEDDKYVYINSAGGQIKLDKRNVDKIEYQETMEDQYAARHAKLAADDVKGRVALSDWAMQNGRADLAVKALDEARKIDPMDKDAAKKWDVAQAQLDLDKKAEDARKAATQPAKPSPATPDMAPGMAPVPQSKTPPLERRLLTDDEINIIRQKEMRTDDPRIKVKFTNGVIKKFLATGNRDAVEFNKLTDEGKALEILANGDANMAKDVRILTDPTLMNEFKVKIYPLIANGCASTSCHGGIKAGNLAFFPGETPAAVYTNFFILQTYTTTVDGVKYQLMDRDIPKHSLVLQYGVPLSMGTPPHPKVTGYRSRFKSETDPAYVLIDDWLSNALVLPQPDYGIKVAAKLPATQPSADAPGK